MITDVIENVGHQYLLSIVPPESIFYDEERAEKWLMGLPKSKLKVVPFPTHHWPTASQIPVEVMESIFHNGPLTDPQFDIIGPETRGAMIERFEPALVKLPTDVQAEGIIAKTSCDHGACRVAYPILRLSKVNTNFVAYIDGNGVLHDEHDQFQNVLITKR